MAARHPPEADEPARAASNQTIDTLEQTARVFRSIAETARRTGDPGLVARLDLLADEAAERAQRLGEHRPVQPAAPLRPARLARVLLVDDHELAREALRSVLSAEQGFSVVGEAADGGAAVRLAGQARPDLVLMDVRMPGMDGLAATRALLAEHPGMTVVMLSSHEDRSLVLEALRAGAAGYLLKGASKQEVLAVLHAAVAGERRVQASLAADLLHGEALGSATAGTVQPLSERELEVLRLMARGHTNEAIGYRLSLTVNTVKTHVRHVLRKLEAPDRAAAVARAAALGLLPAPRP